MRRILAILPAALLILFANRAATEDDASQLADLAKELVRIAKPESGVSEAGQQLSKQLAKLDHKEVVEVMLPLLEHDKKGVPYLASYVILDCKDGLQPEHLDTLKKGYRNGGGWLPSAIGSLGTDEAAEFLAKELRANPKIRAQVDWAFSRMGEQAIPFLVQEFDDADPEREADFFDGLRHVFKEMKGGARSAIPHLIDLAESKDADMEDRKQAALTIGYVGVAAEPFFPRLRALARQDPDNFEKVVVEAIMASETGSSAEILADKVDAGADWYIADTVDVGADWYTIREIALLGTKAKAVGPRVMRWLKKPAWGARVMAARTLGAIGYKESRKNLEDLLSSKSDWRLAYVATRSLVDLQAKESIPALETASREHWFPIVRRAAKEALGSLQRGDELRKRGPTPAGELVDYMFVVPDSLSIDEGELEVLMPRNRGRGRQLSFTAFKERQPALARKFVEVRNTKGASMLEEFGKIIEFPLDDGVLLGAAAGEWVGGLHYAPKTGEHRILLHENITGIEMWKGRVFIASGFDYWFANVGMLHEVIDDEDGVILKPWFVLPGQPTRMWVTEDEKKMVVDCNGGALSFSDDEDFRYYASSVSEPRKTEQ